MSNELIDNLLKELVNAESKKIMNDPNLCGNEFKDKYTYLYDTSKDILNGMPIRKQKIGLPNIKPRIERILDRLGKKDKYDTIIGLIDRLNNMDNFKNPLIMVQFLSWLSLYNSSNTRFQENSFSIDISDCRSESTIDNQYPKKANIFKNTLNDDNKKRESNTREKDDPIVNNRYENKVELIRKRLPKDCLLISNNLSLKTPILLETDLLKDIILVLQALNGKYIRYNNDNERYLFSIDINISNSVKELIYKLSEMGYICRKLNGYVSARSNSKSCNHVTQGIIYCIKGELLEYSKVVSGWDSLMNNHHKCTLMKLDNNNKIPTDLSNSNHQITILTLRKLYVLSRDWAKRLNFMYLILEFISGRSSGSKLSGIRNFTFVGDQLCAQISKKILLSAYRPISYILYQFITQGILNDQYLEFFVIMNKKCNTSMFWQKRFTLKVNLIPNFISYETAYKILMIGKSIGFIKIIQDELNLQQFNVFIDKSNLFPSFTSPGSCQYNTSNDLDIDNIDKKITPIYINTSRILLDLVINDLNFIVHLKAINDYLFLGRGDFILCLMNTIILKQNEKGNKFLSHNIAAILETTIRSTSAQFDNPDVIQRIDCRIYDNNLQPNKLELFTLDYRVDGPLSTIFNTKSMKCYRYIFSFLWKIKYMETFLVNIWFDLFSSHKSGLSSSENHHLLKRFTPIASEMLYFINQLQYYIMFEVIECHQNILMSKIHSATDLDMIINAHISYLQHIVNYCFLSKNHNIVFSILNYLFDNIFSFQQLYRNIFQSNATNNTTLKIAPKIHSTDITNITHLLEQIHIQYRKNMQEFVGCLSSNSDFTVKSLGFRINFNNFYLY